MDSFEVSQLITYARERVINVISLIRLAAREDESAHSAELIADETGLGGAAMPHRPRLHAPRQSADCQIMVMARTDKLD